MPAEKRIYYLDFDPDAPVELTPGMLGEPRASQRRCPCFFRERFRELTTA